MEGIYIFGVGGRVFSLIRLKRGSVNSIFMRFSITIFPGRVSDFRLKCGSRSPPLKALRGSDYALLPPIYPPMRHYVIWFMQIIEYFQNSPWQKLAILYPRLSS